MTFITAEMGASHCRDLGRAREIVKAASASGASAIKLQTWSRMTVADYTIPAGAWKGRKLKELYAECDLPWSFQSELFALARKCNIACFSTPFDRESVDFLETLDCPIYKIASFEITDLELIQHAASTGKPIFISTGMASEREIGVAVDAATSYGAGGVTLLKCTSAYPARPEDANLATMADMGAKFQCEVGLSDHTRTNTAAIAAVLLGAPVVEKHINLHDGLGPDGGFALSPAAFGTLVADIREAEKLWGTVRYGPTEAEAGSVALRRSWWVTRDVTKGEVFTAENAAFLRPMGGMADSPIGATAKHEIASGHALTEELIEWPE